MICVRVCWDYIFTVATSCTCEHGAAAAAPPTQGSWIWHDILFFNIHLCMCIYVLFIYTDTSSLLRNVNFGEANCPWNELIIVALSDVCMLDEVEGLRIRIVVLSLAPNLLFVPLC